MPRFSFISYFLIASLSLIVNNSFATETLHTTIRMATTTSTENSGLLAHLLPKFETESGYKIHVIAVGTGKALRMARDGDVDVVLVHAPAAEKKFVAKGYGDKRHAVMYNDFVVVGPKNDPAGLQKAHSIKDAFRRLADSEQIFISRGDDSGTHKKELTIWRSLALTPKNKNYREAGQGMGKVLQISGELNAYTLIDRGTWLAYKDKSPLTIVFEDDKLLFNPYGIIAVSKNKHSDINYLGAVTLIEWITSTTGQQLIGSYRLRGKQLFTPSAGSELAQSN
ncbi:MAG: substrate-binding domain-containing protein [Gammaproteobacteria bacterium]|nr:substrate-binding domain-containing protein [Gammaproteobacteria bacterium]